MISEPFDPADSNCWIAHGRRPEHAAILADAWRRLPDLPPQAPAEERLARMRERVMALRPVMDSMSRVAEEERHARNFAFTQARAESGDADDRDRAILRARALHGYDWDRAVRYAYGWYAATAGWEPETRRPGCSTPGTQAYDHGFADGGGNRDDLFDTARRAFGASPAPDGPAPVTTGRPLPSTWPKPSDEPLPARWSRRLLILGTAEAGLLGGRPSTPSDTPILLPALRGCGGHAEITTIVVTSAGFHALPDVGPAADVPDVTRDGGLAFDPRFDAQLRALVAGREFDDVLVAAQKSCLALLDVHAAALPLCRTMERTRNTLLQQRAHFRIWLDRGVSAGETLGAGHIRWGKAVKGLTGKLGEFTARYAGKLPAGGHRIVIEAPDGRPAWGYVSVHGEPLFPETVIGNRAHLRKTMAARLRAFGGATRLTSDQPASLLDRAAA